MRQPFITKTIKKNTLFFTLVLFVGYLIFNFFTVLQINYYFIDDIDTRLEHEIGHINLNIGIKNDSLIILNGQELREFDMRHVTDNSFFLEIYDKNGNTLFQSENIKIFQGAPTKIYNFSEKYFFTDEIINFKGLRVCYSKIDVNNKVIGYIALATPKTKVTTAISDIVSFNLITLPIAFLLFLFVSLYFAKRSLNPIIRIIDISKKISVSNLSDRLSYEADEEDILGKLKYTLNDLFERLETQINQISQFTDNASHQLMTPLTAITTELEYILKREYKCEEYKETLINIDEQTKEMVEIVKTLLILARDGEVYSGIKNVFNLVELLKDEKEKMFKDENIIIEAEDDFFLRGDSEYFAMVFNNIISNGIKYSPKGEEIKVVVSEIKNKIRLSIYDKGIGIAEHEKESVFERFYRSSVVEKKGIKGYGLGLNLVKSVVEKMGGTVFIRDNKPKGTVVVIELPKLMVE